MKKWEIIHKGKTDDLVSMLLKNRGIIGKKDISCFLNPPDPAVLTPRDVNIETTSLAKAIKRIQKAIETKESIVVYSDYDADGITAGAVMWETLNQLGARVMPYIPHRVDEGYGLSVKGIDTVKELYNPTLIITVDHGITAREKVVYAKTLGIEVIVTDHHVKPALLPDCTVVHTTSLCGAGVSWFLAKELLRAMNHKLPVAFSMELLSLAAIGTIADMVPLVGANRSIARFGLAAINETKRVGLEALMADAGLTKGTVGTYDISHMIAPRLNAMGRIEHALDALRLLCTKQRDRADLLAQKLGMTNRERQQLTVDTTLHAKNFLTSRSPSIHSHKLIFLSHESYNQGVIGLVAGKLVEEYYRPAIVVSKGEVVSKASARSVAGFNIVEAIKTCSDILIDVGGHPMAAGFTVETKHLTALQDRLENLADKELDEEKLTRLLRIDLEIPLETATEALWQQIRGFEPFGFGNAEPVFATRGVVVGDVRLVGKDKKHLKLRIQSLTIDAIAFGLGELYGKFTPDKPVDIAYSIDMNTWNGNRKLQLKIKDIRV
ncbi:single-stranded-DNA-specific exonuclease RecJ [Candidatus Gottesmanbacteria bacterium]|nr:single-stranded-DNA-specific exonuclease RecJ [Candidatus Gottesmanbacteria bacterium]